MSKKRFIIGMTIQALIALGMLWTIWLLLYRPSSNLGGASSFFLLLELIVSIGLWGVW